MLLSVTLSFDTIPSINLSFVYFFVILKSSFIKKVEAAAHVALAMNIPKHINGFFSANTVHTIPYTIYKM
jgi:hypothetical protein